MYAGAFGLLRMIWPYLKESVFGRATFRTWLRKNLSSVLWFFLMTTMLIVVIYLSTLARSLYRENVDLQGHLDAKVAENIALGKSLEYSRGVGRSMAEELARRNKTQEPASEKPHETKSAPRPSSGRNGRMIDKLKQLDTNSPHR